MRSKRCVFQSIRIRHHLINSILEILSTYSKIIISLCIYLRR
nr:MAG TPA: hypothetical protein [Caudoviricetes sp.]